MEFELQPKRARGRQRGKVGARQKKDCSLRKRERCQRGEDEWEGEERRREGDEQESISSMPRGDQLLRKWRTNKEPDTVQALKW